MTDNIYRKLSEERKRLQAEGLVPEWYSTAGFQLFKERYEYDTNGRSVRGQYERIARTAAKHLKGTKFEAVAEQKFFNLFWNKLLSASTPVMANMGTGRGMPVSCSATVVGDSVDGFYCNLHEVAMLTKNGFGTASYLGDIRPRGSKISGGGKASGVLPVFKEHVQAMRNVAQGTARRGAWAGYIEIDHSDFDELADFILNEPDDANIGWIIKDAFVVRLDAGDEEAVRRYQKAMKLKMVTGKGYFCFIDKINRKRPQMYVDRDFYVKSSNLCLTGDTKIKLLGKKSGCVVKTLEEFVNVLGEKNEEEWKVWSFNTETKLGEWKPITDFGLTAKNAELMQIVDEETGRTIRCTPDHKVFTRNRGYVEAKNLREDDELVIS